MRTARDFSTKVQDAATKTLNYGVMRNKAVSPASGRARYL